MFIHRIRKSIKKIQSSERPFTELNSSERHILQETNIELSAGWDLSTYHFFWAILCRHMPSNILFLQWFNNSLVERNMVFKTVIKLKMLFGIPHKPPLEGNSNIHPTTTIPLCRLKACGWAKINQKKNIWSPL